MKKCAMCYGEVPDEAVKCMHCGSKLNIVRVQLEKNKSTVGGLSRNVIAIVGGLVSIALLFVFLPLGIISFIVFAVLFGSKTKVQCPNCSSSLKADNMLKSVYCFNCKTDIKIEWK